MSNSIHTLICKYLNRPVWLNRALNDIRYIYDNKPAISSTDYKNMVYQLECEKKTIDEIHSELVAELRKNKPPGWHPSRWDLF